MVDFGSLAVENPYLVFEDTAADGNEAVVDVGSGGEDVGEIDGAVEEGDGLGEGVGTQVVGYDERDEDGVGLFIGIEDKARGVVVGGLAVDEPGLGGEASAIVDDFDLLGAFVDFPIDVEGYDGLEEEAVGGGAAGGAFMADGEEIGGGDGGVDLYMAEVLLDGEGGVGRVGGPLVTPAGGGVGGDEIVGRGEAGVVPEELDVDGVDHLEVEVDDAVALVEGGEGVGIEAGE